MKGCEQGVQKLFSKFLLIFVDIKKLNYHYRWDYNLFMVGQW